MKFLLPLMLVGCMKNKALINQAKVDLAGTSDCLNALRINIKNAGCEKVRAQQNRNSVVLQCFKPDDQRGEFWDRYIFRVSDARLKIPQEHADEINAQTICLDKYTRIEAFQP